MQREILTSVECYSQLQGTSTQNDWGKNSSLSGLPRMSKNRRHLSSSGEGADAKKFTCSSARKASQLLLPTEKNYGVQVFRKCSDLLWVVCNPASFTPVFADCPTEWLRVPETLIVCGKDDTAGPSHPVALARPGPTPAAGPRLFLSLVWIWEQVPYISSTGLAGFG